MNYRDSYKYGQSTLQGGGVTNLQKIRTEILQDINESAKPDLFAQNVIRDPSAFDNIAPSAWSAFYKTWIPVTLTFNEFIVDQGNRNLDGSLSDTILKFETDADNTTTRKTSIRIDNKPYYARNGRYNFSGNIFIRRTDHGTGYYILTVTVSVYTLTGVYVQSYDIWTKNVTPLPDIDSTIDIKQEGFSFTYDQLLDGISVGTKIPKNLFKVYVQLRLAHTAPSSINLGTSVLQFKRLTD
jgi:hypothetical protein